MMAQLGITSLRRGAEGMNRQAPNYQNTDEAKANPVAEPARPAGAEEREESDDAGAWWKTRRPEIVEDFDREVYGRVPEDVRR